MATAQAKKRSISPESGKSRSAKSKKKKKEDEEMATETKSQDRHVTKKEKKKPSHSSSSKHKVRNITELAKLVSSGKVNVPQSLVNYTEERLLLLDQLFTILTPDDIRGMLPDILKGLKIKQVKQLCYEQLKNMASEEMKKVIMGESQQLKEEEEEEEEEEEKRHISVKEILELTEELDHPSEKREASSSCSNSSGEASCSRRESDSMTERFPSSAKQISRVEECDLHVSDVSEGESSEGDGEPGGSICTPHSPQDTFNPEAPVRTKEPLSPTPLEDMIELTADSPTGDIDKELCEDHVMEGACKEQDGLSLESSQAIEMMLRQRALEAVLRRRSSTTGDSEGHAEQQDASHAAEEEEEGNRESCSPESPEDSDELEQILRQKALESMLSKRKAPRDKHEIST